MPQLLISYIMRDQPVTLSDLLDKRPGFDVNTLVSHRARRTLVHHAASSGTVNCLVVLRKYGADVNAQEVTGGTCLHICAKNGHK